MVEDEIRHVVVSKMGFDAMEAAQAHARCMGTACMVLGAAFNIDG